MKRLIFSLMLVLPAIVFSQVIGPRIKFDTTFIDLGKQMLNGQIVIDFPFTNVGDAPLIIEGAKATTASAPNEWPKEPIPPGGRSLIRIRFGANAPGPFDKARGVQCNDPTQPVVMLHFKGEMLPPKPIAPLEH